jgi:hypothetical protein
MNSHLYAPVAFTSVYRQVSRDLTAVLAYSIIGFMTIFSSEPRTGCNGGVL